MITIREADADDTAWVLSVSDPLGGPEVVAGGFLHRLRDYPGLIAEIAGERVGFAMYKPGANRWEIVGILSRRPGQGIGTRLLDEVEARAGQSGASQVRLSTTNDNFDALGFTQKRGYRLWNLIPGAFQEAKRLKGIPADQPVIGKYGIEIRDEIILSKDL